MHAYKMNGMREHIQPECASARQQWCADGRLLEKKLIYPLHHVGYTPYADIANMKAFIWNCIS